MIVTVLLLLLIIAALGSLFTMQVSTTRVSQYSAALALAEAKMNDIRAIYYSPPVPPFLAASTYTTNYQNTIDLNSTGTAFLVPGTISVTTQPCGTMGHMVTVTATFQTPNVTTTNTQPITLTLQTLVNSYSGGRQ